MTTEHVTSGFFSSPKRIFGTTNARELGLLYFVISFINASIGGMYAILIRIELVTPEADFFKSARDYNAAFTIHGTGMIFLVIVPLGAGFGNYLIPRMVAADNNDMYWPKWNNFALWMLPFGSFFIWFSQAPTSWVAYPPLSVLQPGVDMWIMGLVLAGTSSTIGGLNFILTIWKGRAPYVKWMKMDLFVWGTLFTSMLVVIATPVLTSALVMLLLDRNFGTVFFDRALSNPVAYQHIFWFYSHPAVYIMVLPAFGLISGMISKFARSPVFGYPAMVLAMGAISVLSVSVWAHHMYTTGINPAVRIFFTSMTFIIAIPSGIKVFNWLTTLYAGRIKFEVPMLFSLAFIIMFTIGGITGVYVNIVSLDIALHDTYWVVGHFHFIVAAGTLIIMFAAIYYYFPDMTGRMYHKRFATLHFWFFVVGNFITFMAFQMLGIEGMPRRYYTYPDIYNFQMWHMIATMGAFMMGIGFIFFVLSILVGARSGDKVENENDPFDLGEEWAYNYPEPFADYVKREHGEELHVEHKLSFWAPAGAWMMGVPLFAVLAFVEAGPFSRDGLLKGLAGPVFGTVLLVLFVIFIILMFASKSRSDIGAVNPVDKYRAGHRHWEMWVFISSEVIFFATLIGYGWSVRVNTTNWAAAQEHLNLWFTGVLAFILLGSSYTMAKAVESIKNDDQQGLVRYLGITILLGLTFLLGQIFEFSELAKDGVKLGEGSLFPLFSSAFYLQTGFHGAHVLVGILFLTFVLLRARNGGYSKENYEYVELIGLYWHFVDIVFIFLLPIVYLI